MASQPPKHSRTAVTKSQAATKSRAQIVKPGRLPVSEFAFDRAGAASPFGDDVVFPLPPDALNYEHPAEPSLPADHQAEPE
jgi:hypothetical protein